MMILAGPFQLRIFYSSITWEGKIFLLKVVFGRIWWEGTFFFFLNFSYYMSYPTLAHVAQRGCGVSLDIFRTCLDSLLRTPSRCPAWASVTTDGIQMSLPILAIQWLCKLTAMSAGVMVSSKLFCAFELSFILMAFLNFLFFVLWGDVLECRPVLSSWACSQSRLKQYALRKCVNFLICFSES